MITRETDYAIRAMLYLARQHDKEVVSTTVLAGAMEIPYRFLRRILLRLGAAGLVVSTRGQRGGLQLARAAEGISLLDLILAVDAEAVLLNTCLQESAHCQRADACVVHEALQHVQVELHQRLASITLATLVTAEREHGRYNNTA